MAELMIAVVILGIGLLITSSMFPIAWYKARDVAESAVIPSLANAGEVTLKMQCRTSQPVPDPNNPIYTTSFFPGDWLPFAGKNPPAVVLPDLRVHHLNAGNYLADPDPQTNRRDVIDLDGDEYPVADDSWRLESNIKSLFTPPAWSASPFPEALRVALGPQVAAHVRLSLTLDAMPDPTATPPPPAGRVQLWEEKFELRRHCWSVFYKFNKMPGLEYAVSATGDINGDGATDALDLARMYELTNQQLKRRQQLTVYYVTLKRPVAARYARQKGYDHRDSNISLVDSLDPAEPVALGSRFDLRLPTPWRFSATLVTLPSKAVAGVPAEIFLPTRTPDGKLNIMVEVLDSGFVLIDDRTGQVFKVTHRRDTEDPDPGIVLTLDGFYDIAGGEYAPKFDPEDAGTFEAWERDWQWQLADCHNEILNVIAKGDDLPDDIPSSVCRPTGMHTLAIGEDEPLRRFYWVYLPPVDAERGDDDMPLFDGSQPVVGVEIRQLTL